MPTLTDTKIRTAKAEAKPYSLQDDPTPAWNTKHRWSSCRNGNLHQQPGPEFLDEIGSKKPDRSP
jgi:hypothetical protein